MHVVKYNASGNDFVIFHDSQKKDRSALAKLLCHRHEGVGADGYTFQDDTGDLYGAIDVALFVLIIGGFLAVTMATGAIDAGIGWITQRFKGREKIMIIVLMIIFALGGTSYGMAEETLAFYGLIIAVMLVIVSR